MELVDRGTGVPLVLIPGIQGRWEYMGPAIDALSRSFRVITFSLRGERGSVPFEPAKGLDNFVDQIDAVLDDRGLRRAVVGGVSFGGLIALHYAARRADRTSALILVSTPGPRFRRARRHELYARAPLMLGPLFLAEIPHRVREELACTMSDGRDRRRFAWRQIKTFIRAPLSLTRMAERSHLLGSADLMKDALEVSAPTLVITGEPTLDYVVPVDGTNEYTRLIPGARSACLARTGHLGYITRPEAFSRIVTDFVRGEGRKVGPDAT